MQIYIIDGAAFIPDTSRRGATATWFAQFGHVHTMLLLFLPLVASRILNSPEDPFAFPKYRVDFLNHLPLANHTAQHWLANGLRGGVREFLDQPWDNFWHPPALGDGDGQASFGVADEDVSLASVRRSRFLIQFQIIKLPSATFGRGGRLRP